ncbi:ShlB/FhaC/HecB family hemolysin secretion/activation protein, partial [Pseudomonas aeruginosa]
SEYQFLKKLQKRTVRLNRDTSQVGIRGDYAFSRSQNQIDNLKNQVTHKRIRKYFSDISLDLSSLKFTTIELGFNHLQIIPNG